MAAQRSMLRYYLRCVEHAVNPFIASPPKLPIDAAAVGLNDIEQLEFHGAYGLTDKALTAVVKSLEHLKHAEPEVAADGPCRARSVLIAGLRAAVRADNSASAYELLQRVAPLLFAPTPAPAQEEDAGHAVATPLRALQPDAVMRSENDFRTYLHMLASRTQNAKVRSAIGAAIALDEVIVVFMYGFYSHFNNLCSNSSKSK